MIKNIKKPSFQLSIGVFLFITTLITGLGVTSLNYNDTKNTISELSNQIFEEASSRIFILIKKHFQKVSQMGFINEKVSKKFISTNEQLRDYFYDTLEEFPEITYFSVSNDSGEMIGADYLSGELKVRHWVQVASKVSEVTEYRKNKKSNKLVEVSKKKDTYDPRVRPWYITAKKMKKPAWVDPYIWLPEKVPGITFTIPSFNDKSRKIDRVLTADIQLSFISDALKKFYQYESGAVFIVNEKGSLIAHSKHSLSGIIKDGESSLPHVKKLKSDQTYIAFKEWVNSGKKNKLEYYSKGNKFLLKSKQLNISENISWHIIMTISEKENLRQALGALYRSIGFSILILVLIIILSLLMSRYLTKNFNRIFQEMKSIFQFSFHQGPRVTSRVYEIDQISSYLSHIKSSLISFQKYIPPVLVKKYLLDGMEAKLGGEEKEVSVMFVDIENYTRISEFSSGKNLIDLLAKFSMIITRNVEKFHGTVDKFIGDSIMIFWGGIDDLQNHEEFACRCALSCYREIKESGMNINIRIGINTGKVVIGNFGSEQRFNFTVLGDNVNQASRLESTNKIYKTNILISEKTFSNIPKKIFARKIDDVILKGKTDTTAIYEIGDWKEEIRDKVKDYYEKAFQAYQSQHWDKSIKYLDRLLDIKKNDGPCLVLKERCHHYQNNPPAKDWDGAFPIQTK